MVSINADNTGSRENSFDRLYSKIGMNSGNLLFTEAARRLIKGEMYHVGFRFEPEQVNRIASGLVIPAANWINSRSDYGDLAKRVSRLQIPLLVLGLGVQADADGTMPTLSVGTMEFLSVISKKAVSISVRGEITARYLREMGIRNVEITGCPSIYMEFQHQGVSARASRSARVVLNSTRYRAASVSQQFWNSVHHEVYKAGYRENVDFVWQSEYEEMEFLFQDLKLAPSKTSLEQLRRIYGADSTGSLLGYFRRHGHAFYKIEEWSQFLSNFSLSIGTRLHSTILALNSGVSSVLLVHDARTHEMARYARIPSFEGSGVDFDLEAVASRAENADFSAYKQRIADCRGGFFRFLRSNGFEPV